MKSKPSWEAASGGLSGAAGAVGSVCFGADRHRAFVTTLPHQVIAFDCTWKTMQVPMTDPPSPPTPRPAIMRRFDFEIEVGEVERHRVHFFFDQFWGPVRVSVDARPVIRGFRMFSLSTVKHYRFTVGERERHGVLIELRRRRMAGGLRSQVCRVFVDRRFVGEYWS